jgi:hypothetical protein
MKRIKVWIEVPCYIFFSIKEKIYDMWLQDLMGT